MNRRFVAGAAVVATGVTFAALARGGESHEADPSLRIGCNESTEVNLGAENNPALLFIDYEARSGQGVDKRSTPYTALVRFAVRNGGVDGVHVDATPNLKKDQATHPMDAALSPAHRVDILAKNKDKHLFPGGPETVRTLVEPNKGNHNSLKVIINIAFDEPGDGIASVRADCGGNLRDRST